MLKILILVALGLTQMPYSVFAKPKIDTKNNTKTDTKNNAKASDSSCFFVNSAGKIINLSTLCGTPDVKQSPKNVFLAKIKRRLTGSPVIDVDFGNRKFEMIVDTGATSTNITSAMAQTLGVVPAGVKRFNTVGANNVRFEVGYVKSIEIDGLLLSNVLVAIVPSLDIGLLGQDFLGGYEITIKQDVIEFRIPNRN